MIRMTALLVLGMAISSLALGAAQEERKSDGAKMQEFKPTKEHELLKQFEGVWDYTSKCMVPGEGTKEGRGTETARLVHGDFWLRMEDKGTAMGKEFSGEGMIGYDPVQKKFCGAWVDNFMPFLNRFEGSVDSSGKIFTYRMLGTDPKTGYEQTARMVMEVKDHDHRSLKFYHKDDSGKEQVMSEMTYTRKAGTPNK